MKIYRRHVEPLGFKGTNMYELDKWHSHYRRIELTGVTVISNMTPQTVSRFDMTPKQVRAFKAGKLGLTPPHCCSPCSGGREMLARPRIIFEGDIKSMKHLKELLEKASPTSLTAAP